MTQDVNNPGMRHSASSVQVESRLAARHIDYRFEPNYSIGSIVNVDGHQVRLIEHRAPSEMISRYAHQMKAGAVFPAIVVNERGELIDGNTRRRAALKAGRLVIPAYICRDLTPLQARALSVELNQVNGLPMREEELRAYVRGVVFEGQTLDTKTCARITGVQPSKLERWKAQAQFEQRAKKCGIPQGDSAMLSESVQASLNSIRLVPVLIEATSVAAAARMPISAVKRMAKEINAATSETSALEVVASERAARADEIRAFASGFVARRRVGQRSSMHIAALLKYEVGDLLEVPPENRQQTMTRLSDLRDHATRAIIEATARWNLNELAVEFDSDGLEPCVEAGSRG